MTRSSQIGFITGQSDPPRCALSPAQQAFLDSLPVPRGRQVRHNFPYVRETAPYRDVPLLTASWHNAAQYVTSRRPAFAGRHRAAVLEMLSEADRTLLLAGSCGLELLANLRLPDDVLRRVHVFAYGPVVRRRPACDIVTVCGRRDWMARAWGGPFDHVVDGHHLNYLTNPAVRSVCREWVAHTAPDVGAE